MKRVKRIVIFFATFFIFISCSSDSKKNVVQFKAMNTLMQITSYGKNASRANKKIQERFETLENCFSTTIQESDVYKINESDSEKIEILHNPTETLLEFSLEMADLTGGALNPALYPVTKLWGFTTESYRVPSDSEIEDALKKTDFRKLRILEEPGEDAGTVKYFLQKDAGMMIDFGAVAKGFSGDDAIRILKDFGIESSLLDLGGNIQVVGSKPDGSEWNIGVKNPWEAGNAALGIKVQDKAVITSGGYERFFFDENGKKYIHIFDPKTGRPVENELESVTIVADSGFYADSLSTAIFVMGSEKATDFWKSNPDFEMILITKDEKLLYTSGIKDKITVIYDFAQVSPLE